MRKFFSFPISASPVLRLLDQQTRTAILVAGALLLSVSISVAAEPSGKTGAQSATQAIDYVQAVFSVQYGNKETAGENLLDIKSAGNSYEINFALDHWMLNSDQYARFEMQDCKVRPELYQDSSKRPFKSKETQELKFNWANHEAIFKKKKDEQKTIRLKDNTLAYDPLSFFFEARCALIDGETEFTYPVIRKGSKKDQTYRVTGEELVQTPLGDFKALVVERVRSNPKRQTRLYVAPELDYLLVKIEHQESAMLKIIATLKDMDYKLKPTDTQ